MFHLAFPLIGINIGHLGFMSEINLPDIERMIDHIKRGDYVIDERMMLEARINKAGSPLTALNDYITKINRTRMVQLDLYVNGTLAELYNGDGLSLRLYRIDGIFFIGRRPQYCPERKLHTDYADVPAFAVCAEYRD